MGVRKLSVAGARREPDYQLNWERCNPKLTFHSASGSHVSSALLWNILIRWSAEHVATVMSYYSLKISRVGTYTSLRRNHTRHLEVSYGMRPKLISLRVTRSACPGLSRLVCNILYSIYRIKYSSLLLPLQLTRSISCRSRVALRDSTLLMVFPVKHASVAVSPLSGLGSTRPEAVWASS